MLRRSCLVLMSLLCLPLPTAEAETRKYLLGMSWETPIVDGIEAQNRAQRRRKSLDAMVRDYTRRSRRRPAVETLYLLARSYGLRFMDTREQAKASRSNAERSRLNAQASRDLASAQSTYRDALKEDPRCYFAYHDLGVLELQRERRSRRKAYDYFIQALQVNTRYVDAIRKLVLLYLEGKQHKNAVQQLRRLLRYEPSDNIARMQLVVGLTKIALFDDALAELQILARENPRHAPYRDLQAQIFVKQGRVHEALELFRDVARENPNIPTPFVGMLKCLEAIRDADQQAVPRFDSYLFALRGLERLERDSDKRAQLADDIAKIEAAQHRPPPSIRDPNKPPTTDEVLQILRASPAEQDRARAIYYFISGVEPVTPRVLKAVARHLVPATEPADRVRAMATRVLGDFGGSATIGMVRLTLDDDSAVVRASAVDTLAVVAARDGDTRRALIVVLGLMVKDRDATVSAAARQAILRLDAAVLQLPEGASASMHARAFREWWEGPIGVDLISNGLERYGKLPDRFPEDVYLAYVSHPSMVVGRSAYDALGRIAAPGDTARGQWLARRPVIASDAWSEATWNGIRTKILVWAQERVR